jgi:hypothetical protein
MQTKLLGPGAVATLLTTLLVASVTASACSGEFTSCEETRTCSNGGTSYDGGAGGDGLPAGQGGENSTAVGGVPGGGGSDSTIGGGGDSGGGRGGGGGVDGSDDGGAGGGGGEPPSSACGNGHKDAGEDCDLGAANSAAAYGPGKCTDKCKEAPFCGDSKKNGTEACDEGGTSVNLGACNPECSGYFEKKYIKLTSNTYSASSVGGIAGADAKCVLAFGAGWKALLVGGGRRATTKPFLGDDAKDWVLKKYTYYYNAQTDALIWRTDAVALLGVRDGTRVNVYADAFGSGYPWSGWKADWTTLPDSTAEASTCASWTSDNAGYGAFCFPDLRPAASELCTTPMPLLCVEQ